MPPTAPQQGSQPTNPEVREIIWGLLRSICFTIDVFLHRRFGSRYVSGGIGGVLVIFVFAAASPPEQQFPLLCFLAVYTVWWLAAWINSMVRGWRGRDKEHGGYTGEPLVQRWLPRWREECIKQVEAWAVILLGLVIHRFTHPLADYLIFAASLVLIRIRLMIARQRRQAMLLNDMVIEQKAVSELFRARQ